jgi:GT2 family glycosyltransferase
MTTPLISIIILNYNTRELLIACLESIQTYAADCEVIVVDNASTDHSAPAVQQKFPNIKLIANPDNYGFARGINAGLHAATAPLLLTLNADTTLRSDTLPPLVQAMLQLPHAGILGPVQYLPVEAAPDRFGPQLASVFPDPTLAHEAQRLLFFGDSLAARFQRGPWRTERSGPPRRVDWLMGAALLIRRECLDDIQGFDENQFMYGEDWDICYRARRANWQVYLVPDAKIIHHENAAGKQQFGTNRQARVLRANFYFHEKHYSRASRRVLAALCLLGAGLRLALLFPIRLLKRSDPKWLAHWQTQIQVARVAASGLKHTLP